MRGEVKTVASNAISLYFGLHEFTPEEIKDHVGWLLKGSVFAYDGVNIKVFLYTQLLDVFSLHFWFCRPKLTSHRLYFSHL